MSKDLTIETTLFGSPSGNVRGIIIGLIDVNGKPKRIAYASLLTDREPAITLDIPGRVPLELANQFGESLVRFTEEVAKVCQAPAPKENLKSTYVVPLATI